MSDRLLRLPQIIGQEEVTQDVAEVNKAKAAVIREEFPVDDPDPKKRKMQKKALAKKLAKIGPRSRKPRIKGIINVSSSTWWAGVASGRFPKPVHLGPRVTCWRESSILALMKEED